MKKLEIGIFEMLFVTVALLVGLAYMIYNPPNSLALKNCIKEKDCLSKEIVELNSYLQKAAKTLSKSAELRQKMEARIVELEKKVELFELSIEQQPKGILN